ncbi:DUF4440 domain-containing protein [Psychromonas antarctica]|jgi:hypothetical protein|uniref:nuclear transport factor 2 family protein n=1 Tax=Psychromonas antarctica TaxID=67573 RepID=UPI001EE82C10|nr:nuclear transport factor 2 family protein [Psychromonas antarctica]MCG6201649.1 nuclear transport factor 2 family protein [Psychromonas antarctica]
MDIIIEQEMALHQVWFRTNKSVVERLLHPEFREVEESGRSYNFHEIVSFMESEKHSEDRVHSQDYELINLESSSILLLYKSALLKPTGEYSSFAKRSSIWVKSDGRWQMKYHQGTNCEAFEINT